jgi:MarC family membrane protein
MLDLHHYVRIFIGVFVIVNPLGLAPAFLSLTSDRTPEEATRTARTAAIAACLLLLSAAVSGNALLNFFGIGVEQFRVAGGLLLLFVGIDMLHAKQSHHKQTPEEAEEASQKPAVGIVPLAIPLLAGPGSHEHSCDLCPRVVQLDSSGRGMRCRGDRGCNRVDCLSTGHAHRQLARKDRHQCLHPVDGTDPSCARF